MIARWRVAVSVSRSQDVARTRNGNSHLTSILMNRDVKLNGTGLRTTALLGELLNLLGRLDTGTDRQHHGTTLPAHRRSGGFVRLAEIDVEHAGQPACLIFCQRSHGHLFV